MHQAQWSPERPLPPPVYLASQSHHEKPPEVTCTSRGNPGFPASTRESPREPFFNTSRGQIPLPWLGSNDALPLATRMETRHPWRPTRGSLTSPSYLVRNRALGPPLENNPEIPAALEKVESETGILRDQGCRKVVLAGHSLGACAALAYAARRGGIDGLILLAPAHFPERLAAEGHTGDSLAAARAALGGPEPGKRIPVVDVNQGVRHRLRIAPAIYLSYFDPAGPASWPANARALSPELPVLWVAGKDDPAYPDAFDYAFDLSPAHPRRYRALLATDHAGTPGAATGLVLDWLPTLEHRPQ